MLCILSLSHASPMQSYNLCIQDTAFLSALLTQMPTATCSVRAARGLLAGREGRARGTGPHHPLTSSASYCSALTLVAPLQKEQVAV